jgi:hypothetical protein
MTSRLKIKKWLPAVLAGLAMAGTPTLCLAAASPITNNFDAGIEGWVINYVTPTGEAAATWNKTAGVDGSGCLQITLTNGGSKVGPLWQTMPASYSTADYTTYEFDMMLDPVSGTDGQGAYGNFQTVMRDASWGWDGHWIGAMDSSYTSWKHVSVTIPPLPVKTETMLGFEVAAASGAYNADVIIYVDNLVIKPMQNPWVVHPFTSDSEISTTLGFSSTSAATAPTVAPAIATSIDTSKDAGGGFSPAGSLKLAVTYDPTSSDWQEGRVQWNTSYDPSRYSSFEFDVFVDSTNAGGIINCFVLAGDWSWNNIGTINVNSTYVGKWTHCSVGLGGYTKAGGQGFILQCGGGSLAPTTYYFDNVQFVKSSSAPEIVTVLPGTPRGVQVAMDDNNAQWQREGITTPSDAGDVFWAYDSQTTPVTYSFTLSDFPEAKSHGGFSAHLFFVNGDTDTNTGDPTTGSVDWNAGDLIDLNVTANAGGGYDYALNWKTNKPSANTDHRAGSLHSETALGTWSLTFTSPTSATMAGPGGVSTNLTLPAEIVTGNFNPGVGYLHFGMFKNDAANDGHNNGATGTFSRLQKTGGSYTFDEAFNGTNLLANYNWRVSRASSVHWVPDGVGRWMTWTLPADGFSPQVAPALTGPWKTVTSLVEYSTSTHRTGAISSSDIGQSQTSFFRLISP